MREKSQKLIKEWALVFYILCVMCVYGLIVLWDFHKDNIHACGFLAKSGAFSHLLDTGEKKMLPFFQRDRVR